MRVGIDATPLLGQRSGVGRYVDGLLGGLAELRSPPETRLTLFSIRGEVPDPLPPGSRRAPRRAPARLLRPLWSRTSWPPVELLCGLVDVFHGTNFVLPPSYRARGVVTVHDLAYLRFPETVTGDAAEYARLVPRALARGAHVIAVTEAMAAEIADEYRLPPDRVSVAHHGVDPTWSTTEPATSATLRRLGLPDRYLLFTGNLEPRKNLGLLLRAHRAARLADPAVPPLVLVGPAGWGDRWHGDRPEPGDVVLAGYLDEPDLRAVVAGAVASCLPSSYEGFGLPVVEALATGTRVLASDIGAHREIGGDACILLAHDTDTWAGALVEVSTTPGDGGTAARRRHASRFTWRASAEAHVRAYETARAT